MAKKRVAVLIPYALYFSRLPDSLGHSEIPGEITPDILVGTGPMTPANLEQIGSGAGVSAMVVHRIFMSAYPVIAF